MGVEEGDNPVSNNTEEFSYRKKRKRKGGL
jgi:hypothetical protein